MRHLDEGRLQAWLDGPRAGLADDERARIARHLEACAECADRLEALRDEAERAGALLGTPLPGGPPAFDDVVARAERVGDDPSTRRPARRWRATGWAASIVMAAGAGWMANDLIRRDPVAVSRPAAVRTDEAPAPALEATGIRPGASTATAEPAVEAPPDPVADVARPADADEGAQPPAAPLPAPAERERQAAPVEGARARSAEEAARRDRAPEEAPGHITGRVIDASSGRPLESAQVFVPELGAGALTGSDGRFLLALGSSSGFSAADSLTLAVELIGYGAQSRSLALPAGDTVVPEFRLETTAVALQQLVVSGAPVPPSTAVSLSEGAWTAAGEGDAADALGGVPARVPGLAVVGLETGLESGLSLVRLTHALDDGEPLVLIQAAGAFEVVDLPDGWSITTTERGGRWIAAAAALPREALEALLARVR